ncbi:MAG: LAGLIDADG family homing endonuclease [Nanoarchaeota archaeon]|nr:LAGLIDADG family homing endonuclease [Nanoarchaeota archaeon]
MQLNENTAELIGAIMGDGNIYRRFNKYRIGFTGHPVTDKLYFEYLKKLIKLEMQKEGRIVDRKNSIQMVVNSKENCLFLINDMKILSGKEKSLKALIPQPIKDDWNLMKRFIRGIVDTDGSVFAVRKPRVEKYPSIEITTINKPLAGDIKSALESNGFRVSEIWSFKQKLSKNLGYRFGLNGKVQLKKWINEIGFSNPYKFERAISYLK